MNLDFKYDIGAPLAVTLVNTLARRSSAMVGNQPIADIMTYVMGVGGYLVGAMGWGGDKVSHFMKNVGIAAAPLMFEKIYSALAGQAAVSRGVGMRRVARYPGPAAESPFNNVRLV